MSIYLTKTRFKIPLSPQPLIIRFLSLHPISNFPQLPSFSPSQRSNLIIILLATADDHHFRLVHTVGAIGRGPSLSTIDKQATVAHLRSRLLNTATSPPPVPPP
ncbi:hypothetical protein RND81_13G050200 [Saponaria officinalis]|uniref:Uncharacterized protein n=1 Tax=Saponaria officinalis TaxID=3572 RepID=A0AAW1GTX6_SAPOF